MNTRLESQTSTPQSAQIVGVVRDTSGVPIQNATVVLAELRRDFRTAVDGTFRVFGIAPGVYTVSVRAIGYVGTTRNVVLDTGSTSIIVELSRSYTSLPAVVSRATRGGLAGIVRDSSGVAVAGAEVRANGAGVGATTTDSAGRFFLAVKGGRYFVRIEKRGYRRQMVSVTVPVNEGRQIVAALSQENGPRNPREAANLFDLQQRMIRANPVWSRYVSREDIANFNVKNAKQIAQHFAVGILDDDECAFIDGGPLDAPLWSINADEIEFMETTIAAPRPRVGAPAIFDGKSRSIGRSPCGHVVWLRR